jgi:MoxR-like ATPase
VTAVADPGLEERDRELEAIAAVLRTGGALLIEGPPGIGKTRLLGWARAASGVRVLSSRVSFL